MSAETITKGACYCGEVSVEAIGLPLVDGYCHCSHCRSFHAAPFVAWRGWREENVTIAGDIAVTDRAEQSKRISCKRCGGIVANRKPQAGMIMLYPPILTSPGTRFSGGLHLFYGERVMDVADGLPKFLDAPSDFGGSNAMVDEPNRTGWLT